MKREIKKIVKALGVFTAESLAAGAHHQPGFLSKAFRVCCDEVAGITGADAYAVKEHALDAAIDAAEKLDAKMERRRRASVLDHVVSFTMYCSQGLKKESPVLLRAAEKESWSNIEEYRQELRASVGEKAVLQTFSPLDGGGPAGGNLLRAFGTYFCDAFAAGVERGESGREAVLFHECAASLAQVTGLPEQKTRSQMLLAMMERADVLSEDYHRVAPRVVGYVRDWDHGILEDSTILRLTTMAARPRAWGKKDVAPLVLRGPGLTD